MTIDVSPEMAEILQNLANSQQVSVNQLLESMTELWKAEQSGIYPDQEELMTVRASLLADEEDDSPEYTVEEARQIFADYLAGKPIPAKIDPNQLQPHDWEL